MADDLLKIAAPHPTRTLIAMTGSLSMIFLDATVVGVALPTIQVDLNLTTSSAAWIVNGFLLAFASSLALGGRIADRFGRLRVFRFAMLLFAAASLLCGIAQSAAWLIAARAVQGIAAGMMQPASTAMVISSAPENKRGVTMAMYFGVALLFLLAGPIIGGSIIALLDWHWIFLLNLPVALTALLLTIGLGLPVFRAVARSIDVLGIILLLLGMPVLVLGLEWIAQPPGGVGWLPPLLTVIGLVCTVACLIHCARTTQPVLNIRLLAPKPLLGQTLVLAIGSLIMASQSVFGAIYLQEVLGFTPLRAGVAALPLLLPVLLVIRSAGKWYDRSGAGPPMIAGMTGATIGLAVETVGIMMHSYVVLACGMVLVGIGSTIATTPANTDILSRAPQANRGEVSGLVQTGRQFGASLGIVACVLAVSFMLAPMTLDLKKHHSGDVDAMQAIQGNVHAIKGLESRNPALALEIRAARSNGIASAFALQGLVAALGIMLSLTLARPHPESPAAD